MQTYRDAIFRATATTWPAPDLMATVTSMADVLERSGDATRASVMVSVHPLYAVVATSAERQHARQQLLGLAALADQAVRTMQAVES
jgi:hypothetical protein